MYLHLGQSVVVPYRDVIGIFDMDSATVCASSRHFLSQKEKEGRVESDGELPKSFLLCEKREKADIGRGKRKKIPKTQKKEVSVFLSRLSSSVLAVVLQPVQQILNSLSTLH